MACVSSNGGDVLVIELFHRFIEGFLATPSDEDVFSTFTDELLSTGKANSFRPPVIRAILPSSFPMMVPYRSNSRDHCVVILSVLIHLPSIRICVRKKERDHADVDFFVLLNTYFYHVNMSLFTNVVVSDCSEYSEVAEKSRFYLDGLGVSICFSLNCSDTLIYTSH